MPQEHQVEAQRAAGIREPKMHAAYVLLLGCDENGVHKYYVGSTENWMRRLHDHIQGNESSARWVRKWKFVELIETRHCHDRLSALITEVGLTVVYKAKHGWGNARGGQDVTGESSKKYQPAYWEGLERSRRNRSRSPPRPDSRD